MWKLNTCKILSEEGIKRRMNSKSQGLERQETSEEATQALQLTIMIIDLEMNSKEPFEKEEDASYQAKWLTKA